MNFQGKAILAFGIRHVIASIVNVKTPKCESSLTLQASALNVAIDR
jgi:hypothetical protein